MHQGNNPHREIRFFAPKWQVSSGIYFHKVCHWMWQQESLCSHFFEIRRTNPLDRSISSPNTFATWIRRLGSSMNCIRVEWTTRNVLNSHRWNLRPSHSPQFLSESKLPHICCTWVSDECVCAISRFYLKVLNGGREIRKMILWRNVVFRTILCISS